MFGNPCFHYVNPKQPISIHRVDLLVDISMQYLVSPVGSFVSVTAALSAICMLMDPKILHVMVCDPDTPEVTWTSDPHPDVPEIPNFWYDVIDKRKFDVDGIVTEHEQLVTSTLVPS